MDTEQPFDITPRDLHAIREKYFDDALFEVSADGDVELLDLLSGEQQLGPGQIPPCLTTFPSLSAGLDFLRERGRDKSLTIQLMLAPHGAAQHWEVMAETFGDMMKRVRWFGVEMSWTGSTSPILARGGQGAPRGVGLRLDGREGRRSFKEAQLTWLGAQDVLILPCELPDDDGDSALSYAP